MHLSPEGTHSPGGEVAIKWHMSPRCCLHCIADTPEGVALLQEDLRAESEAGLAGGRRRGAARQVPPGRGGTRMMRRKEGGAEEDWQ